jgi:protocatechuate 3,4-dioxygenase beta subunit
MRNLRIASLLLLSFVLAAGSEPLAQQVIINGQPGGDIPFPMLGGQPRQFKTGTGRIRGRVISTETGGPVRRAQVRINGPEIAAKTALTDAEGRYEFRDLPAGRFNLSGTKSGFVTVQYGQTRPFESGKAIELADAQVLDKADIQMPRGSVVSGRVLDEFGDPVADANVSALRSTWTSGKRRLQPTGRTAQTNDLGQYRIYGLPPGDYYVSATFRGGPEMMVTEMAMGMALSGGAAGPSASNSNSGYAPTYFPGTTSGGDAQKITLAVGQEAQNTDFALLPVRLAKVTGTVISSDGKPMDGAMVNAVPRGGDIVSLMGFGNTARADKNGNFTMMNVPPGDYNLQTRGGMQIMSSGDNNTMVFQTRVTVNGAEGGPGGGEAEVGSTAISVSGEDLSNVILVTSKGATASGRLVFEGGAKPPTMTNIRITAMAADTDMMQMGGTLGTVKADGSFEMKGLGGTRLLRPVGLPQGWTLKAIRNVAGADVTDSGLDFKPGDAVAGIDIVLTSKLTDVSGTVKGSDGQPAKDYTVVLFSDEPQKWLVPSNRYVTAARPNQDGRFQVKNLPAGGYYAVALEYVAQGEWGDPELLQRLVDKATKFSLDDGDTKTLDLKIVQ